MKKFSIQIPVAKLRKQTHFKTGILNDTTGSSTFVMRERFIEIKDFLLVRYR